MPTISINNKDYEVPEGITIIQACELAEIEVPRFCYHERLEIAGNCRMCLVEVAGGPPKPVASCAMPVANGMKVFTDTPMVKKAREGVMEFLLANHPLDCPICDQGGECDLQDQAYQYGRDHSDYHEHKRAVKDKDMGPLIKTTMTRCIHCTRCVRFITDVAGVPELGAIGRGEKMEITPYVEKALSSELSGNIIDLCPVGALTSKPYAFHARSWELKKTESIDVMDALGSAIRIDSRGLEIMRILPRLNEEINEEWISDKARFCYDGLKYQRLDSVYTRKDGKLEKSSFDEAYQLIAQKLKDLEGNEIAALSGPLAAAEEIFALKTLMQKLDSKNFESRLKDEKLQAEDRASYLFNSSVAGIDEADACLLIGVNPRKDAPVLNARIRKRSINKHNPFAIATVGVEADLSYKYKNLGDDIATLEKILEGKSEFSEILAKAKKPMLILGVDAVSGKAGAEILNLAKKIAEKFNMIQDHWNGFNFLAKSSGLINGLELEFTSSHGIGEILENAKHGKIKLAFLLGVDEDIDFAALQHVFKIYIGSNGDQGAHHADIILPAAAFSEKEVTYINCEGRAQQTTRAIFAPESAKEDWKIITEIANASNIGLGFHTLTDLKKALNAKSMTFANLKNITKAKWLPSSTSKALEGLQKISAQDFDFYSTNAIARSSRVLAKCGNQ